MHLRSIEIQGFKTFAKKTELLFEPGITAVVGPNGSGKSNLVDAIRWVLGERSARELRGTRMEEIVYSGGARRPASGMAEVRLVIDNADGRLPVPYQEVEVVRRGYRSGESEFFLNGSRCRLRDVEELLSSTGLTQEGYAVVAQDDVDHIIQTSAAERRALIEEAAGVRGLRGKRDDALSRIRESDTTVLRLNDLAGELGPRVEELRRQADAAQAEAELTQRLDVLRGSLLRGEWLAARQRVKKAATRAAGLADAVDAARNEAEAAALAHTAQRERLARAHDARLTRERELGSLRLAVTEAAARLQLLAERLVATDRAIADLAGARVAAEAHLESLRAELTAAREDADTAATPSAAAETDPDLVAARQAHGAARDRREAAEERDGKLRQAAADAKRRVAEIEQQRQALTGAGQDLGAELARAEAELAAEEATATEVRTAESAARDAADRFESAMAARGLALALVEQRRLQERDAMSRVERLEERLSALRSLAADGDLPAPSAARLVDLLENQGVRAAALAAGIAAATLDSWLEEGRLEGRAIARALEDSLAEQHRARAEAEATAVALAAAQLAQSDAQEVVEQARQEQLSALAAVSAAAARDNARAQRLDVARHRAQRLRASVGDRGADLAKLMERLGDASAAVSAAAQAAAEAQPELERAAASEASHRELVEQLQRRADQREAQRAALAARVEALMARRDRAEAKINAQVAEVERVRRRGQDLDGTRAVLDAERLAAEQQHAAARAGLAAAPADPAAIEVDALTEQLLVLEKEHMDRQVALAHLDDGLAVARGLMGDEDRVLGELAARMGAAGEVGPDDEELDWEKTQREIARLERQINHLGPVNPLAIEEYRRDQERLGTIAGQLDDLIRTREGLVKLSDDLSAEIDRRFEAVFGAVAYNFQETFGTLFVNGKATLKLDDPEADEPGVEILAQPAGKRMRGIRLLSGGERALTALAFILALEKVNPSPFYIFDEVDAPLDDANVKRFNAMLQSMAGGNQFILITHNHQTMTSAQALYGVTLEDSGVSRVVSVRLREGEVIALPAARTS